MNRIIYSLMFMLFVLNLSLAQQGVDIKVKLNNYYYDTLWFGNTFGKRAVPDFYGLKNSQGFFELKTNTPIPAGMYAIIFKRASNANYQYIQCWVAEGQRSFTVATNVNSPYDNPQITGSAENAAFYAFLRDFRKKDESLDSAITEWRLKQDDESFRQRVKAEEQIHQFHEEFIKANPGSLSAKLVRQTQLMLPPNGLIKTSDWKQEAAERWHWQREHYFDRIDLAGTDFMGYPQWLDRADFYIFYLPPPHPDTTKAVMDEVLSRLSSNPPALEYYQKYLTNSLARMSQFRMDEVFVHMVKNYILEGKAPWTEDQDMQRLRNEANMMEPLFVGRKASDVTLFTQSGESVRLHGLQAPAILLTFYLPDCSHCKKEIPILKQVAEKFKSRGLKVISVCGKYREETPQCWEFVREQGLPEDWYNLADPEFRSRMSRLFNLRSFPRIFILDAGKNIVLKRAGESSELELSSYLEQVLPAQK